MKCYMDADGLVMSPLTLGKKGYYSFPKFYFKSFENVPFDMATARPYLGLPWTLETTLNVLFQISSCLSSFDMLLRIRKSAAASAVFAHTLIYFNFKVLFHYPRSFTYRYSYTPKPPEKKEKQPIYSTPANDRAAINFTPKPDSVSC